MNTLHTAKKNLIAHTVISCFLPLALIGCGDDSGTASAPNGADGLVSTMDDLLNCTANHEGETYFVTEQKSTYICVDNKWMDFAPTMDDLLNCTMNRESKTVYVNEHNSAYVCMDEKWYPQRDVPYIKEKSSSSVKSSSSDARFSSSIVTPTSSSSVTPQSSSSETRVSTGTMTDSRDGQTYKTVTIGTQTWMAQNLNYETANSYCYDDNASNCTKYGRLYRWVAAVGKSESECGKGYTCSLPSGNIQGVCPSGWHLPSKAEWETLFNAVGGQSTAGMILKSTSGWNSSGNGSDAFAFSALPAGNRSGNGVYYDEGNLANFWSSTEGTSDFAYSMRLSFDSDIAPLSRYGKNYGFSVRCLKD